VSDRPEHVPVAVRPDAPVSWDRVAAIAPLVRAADGAPARLRTDVRLAHDGRALHVRFECEDPDPWSTHRRRDDPLWDQDAVELFLAPGASDPARYVEFEVSPHGVLFDAVVVNPDGDRSTMRVDPAWDCPGVVVAAGRGTFAGGPGWWAELSVPWMAVLDALGAAGGRPDAWRANLYRIDRPRDGGEDEFSAWAPTGRVPPDFHVPARFGLLRPSPDPAPRQDSSAVRRVGGGSSRNDRGDPSGATNPISAAWRR